MQLVEFLRLKQSRKRTLILILLLLYLYRLFLLEFIEPIIISVYRIIIGFGLLLPLGRRHFFGQ